MQTYDKQRGEPSSILEHSNRSLPMNGVLREQLHFNVEFVTASGELSTSWEPITLLYRQKPDIVTNYCA